MELLTSAVSTLTDRPAQDISLIVDGGPENNNRLVQAWIADAPVRKLVAQVDVSFSNSMIEAVNKIIKYRYLFRKPIPDLDHIPETVSAAIADYNSRPHYAHHGLSPNEVHNGKVFDQEAYRLRLREAGGSGCGKTDPYVIRVGPGTRNRHQRSPRRARSDPVNGPPTVNSLRTGRKRDSVHQESPRTRGFCFQRSPFATANMTSCFSARWSCAICERLNTRPRKRLGYSTPKEVCYGLR